MHMILRPSCQNCYFRCSDLHLDWLNPHHCIPNFFFDKMHRTHPMIELTFFMRNLSHDDFGDGGPPRYPLARTCPVFGLSWLTPRERSRCWRPRRPCSQERSERSETSWLGVWKWEEKPRKSLGKPWDNGDLPCGNLLVPELYGKVQHVQLNKSTISSNFP